MYHHPILLRRSWSAKFGQNSNFGARLNRSTELFVDMLDYSFIFDKLYTKKLNPINKNEICTVHGKANLSNKL